MCYQCREVDNRRTRASVSGLQAAARHHLVSDIYQIDAQLCFLSKSRGGVSFRGSPVVSVSRCWITKSQMKCQQKSRRRLRIPSSAE